MTTSPKQNRTGVPFTNICNQFAFNLKTLIILMALITIKQTNKNIFLWDSKGDKVCFN
jgi:hypothetical protein